MPPTIGHDAEDREKRLAAAVKCLDELIIIIMERIAAQSRIDEEELASACQAGTVDEDDEPRMTARTAHNYPEVTLLPVRYPQNGTRTAPEKSSETQPLDKRPNIA